MPLQDWNDPATWANAYRLKKASDPNEWAIGDGGYVRDCSMFAAAPAKAARFIQLLGINSSHTVGVIGAGFGWIAAQIAAQAGCVVAAVDTSTYIQDRKLANADVEIINADVSAGSGRAAIRQALGISGNSKASFMITEDTIGCLSDAECVQLSTFLNNISDSVVHWTSELDTEKQGSGNQDTTGWNWKTIEQWKVLLPTDTIISANDWEMV